ncbi:MAG: hypothetical protein A3H67_04255 [Candidatus Buchananbacteria bacterium RIFCSPLOWO2_02_FULL_46_11b]|uniref:Uncharacterized protein n=1 Tax=Candidatus Buchananbacteria bacterium RIFCSPLOWO2_02_FULL_46_11b TaxID=1797548 RepID=A0A1G1YVW8_9BACT|nr:MAG: hypothetical protein A3H67_04255 [Candidatus Buchananbacteria bacterium RIFCSPLOWO2_02_FULL_46_11b]
MEVNIGGQDKNDLIREIKEKFKVSSNASDMLKNPEFTVSKTPESISLIRLKVSDLGFPKGATTEEIYQKAEELGLELCPAETGPQLRKQYINQPLDEWLNIGMKQIVDSDGSPNVFYLRRLGGGLWLRGSWAEPGSRWGPGHGFAFRLRKLNA